MPNQLALAWLLHLPCQTFAIIGPANVQELTESVAATDIELTDEEVRWLAADGPGR